MDQHCVTGCSKTCHQVPSAARSAAVCDINIIIFTVQASVTVLFVDMEQQDDLLLYIRRST